jgi:hypothetical protein
MTETSVLDGPAWERAMARRFPTPCSKHYVNGYKAGYEVATPRPPARRKSTAPAWMLDNADWYTKGYNHGYMDRAQDDAQAANDGE